MADKPQGITQITVQAFKSLYDKASIKIRPLTLLAGANSSGKSSIMQPFLLLKQTLESDYDPGQFLLNGSNVRFTNTEQMVRQTSAKQFLAQFGNFPLSYLEAEEDFETGAFMLGIEKDAAEALNIIYAQVNGKIMLPAIEVYDRYDAPNHILLLLNSPHENIVEILGDDIDKLRQALEEIHHSPLEWRILPNRAFLQPAIFSKDGDAISDFGNVSLKILPIGSFRQEIQDIIHVPGLRGNPERSYPVTAVNLTHFEGTFEPYTASIIFQWNRSEDEEDKNQLSTLIDQLHTLNLTSIVTAQPLNDAQIEVRVGRTINSKSDDTVSIADVGFGVSQVLPVLVALLVAKPGQLVYLEQPELHLHPRAQVKLAEIIAEASKRGVRVVVETHSSLLLLGIQTLIAENKLNHEDVILHWFKRGEDGKTTVDSVEPDENGAYGEWPEDFADVELKAQSDYLDAVATREAVE